MASKVLLGAILVIIIIVAYFAVGIVIAWTHNVAIQITDSSNGPSGTQSLLVSYSSVAVNVSGTNQTGWVSATGSGTLNLTALANVSQTVASAGIEATSTINAVRFNITSATIEIGNTTYNVTWPGNQITVAVNGQNRVNSSAAVLINFHPTITSSAGANGTVYVMVPMARAIVMNTSTTSINTNIGNLTAINETIRTKLGSGSGLVTGNSSNGTYVASENVRAGQRVSNFMIESVNYSSSSIMGLLFVQYPVATNVGINTTIRINDMVGYECDNTEFRLTAIYPNNTAAFMHIANTSTYGGCPI